MRYAIYLRKSRADDTSEPLEVTLQRHRQMLEKYMQQHDIAVQDEDVFEEVVSGDSLYLVYIDHAVTGNADGVYLFTVEAVLGEELVEGVSVARL